MGDGGIADHYSTVLYLYFEIRSPRKTKREKGPVQRADKLFKALQTASAKARKARRKILIHGR
jgi:hypothetical protein